MGSGPGDFRKIPVPLGAKYMKSIKKTKSWLPTCFPMSTPRTWLCIRTIGGTTSKILTPSPTARVELREAEAGSAFPIEDASSRGPLPCTLQLCCFTDLAAAAEPTVKTQNTEKLQRWLQGSSSP
jgi:hypothetical protein